MQSKSRYLIKNIVNDAWLNRMADDVTLDAFKGISFDKKEDAEQWLYEGIHHAPRDRHNYKVQEMLVTIQEGGE